MFRSATFVAGQRNSEERRGGDYAPDSSPILRGENAGRVLIVGGTSIHGIEQSAELYDSLYGMLSSTGGMLVPRVYHAAIKLQDGRVLILGGNTTFYAEGFLKTAEIYDPHTAAFSPTAEMNSPRQLPRVARLPSGDVLVAGGYDGAVDTKTAEIYKPTTGVFVPTGIMIGPHQDGTAILLPDGRVLVAGSISPSIEIFDPAIGLFRTAGETIEVRTQYTATLMNNNKILIAGGQTLAGRTEEVISAEIYDP